MTATTFIGHFLGPDTHTNRPSATGLANGTMYVCTTHSKIERVVSGAWADYATVGVPAGTAIIATDPIWDVKGDLAVGSGADTAARLAVGTNGQILTADSAQTLGVKWAAAAGGLVADTIWDAKGDLAVGTGADTAARLAVGTDGQILTADSAQTTGAKWATPAAGGTGNMNYRGAWNSSFRYATNDVVTYNGILYAANQANGPTGIPTNLPLLAAAADFENNFGTFTVTVPSAAKVGDLIIIAANFWSTTTSPAAPAGFTPLTSVINSAANANFYVWTKTATAGDIGATVTVGKASEWAQAILAAYTTSGIDQYTSATTTSGTLAVPTSLVSSGNETVVAVFAGTTGFNLASGGTNQNWAHTPHGESAGFEDFQLATAGTHVTSGGTASTTGSAVVAILLKGYTPGSFPASQWDLLGAPLQETVNTVAASGSAQTLPDITVAQMHRIVLTANCTFTFPAAGAGKEFTIAVVQDGTGSRTVTWPGAVKWGAGGSAPTLTTTASKADIFTFVCLDGTNWNGIVRGMNY